MTYQEALRYIYSLTNYEVTPAKAYAPGNFDLARMQALLSTLGSPESKFKSVHIAGTKGKGSTAAMLASILRHSDYRTGLYTSPHLHTFRERIQVDGTMISETAVADGIERIRPLAERLPRLTTFEVMTALAFDYFSRQKVEIAVLEVGLGGRLDATNVVLPLVSIITSISFDHTAILGNTLGQIAGEKAGIIKPGVPAVVSPQAPEALAVIERAAQAHTSPLTLVSADLSYSVAGMRCQVSTIGSNLDGQKLLWACEDRGGTLPRRMELTIPLVGRHQVTNAATALAATSVLQTCGLTITDTGVQAGLAEVQWPGRFEVLSREPTIVVDGAHNADSAHQLWQAIHDYYPHSDLRLIFGASNDKDVAGMFAELLPHAQSLVLTRSHNPRAADPVQLTELAQPYRIETSIAPDLESAIRETQRRAGPSDLIVVTGSLFVVAEARRAWLQQHGGDVPSDR